MPMWDRGVPDRHTTATQSSKIGARKVAPASATTATMPEAPSSITAMTSAGDSIGRHGPATGAASKTLVPRPTSRSVLRPEVESRGQHQSGRAEHGGALIELGQDDPDLFIET